MRNRILILVAALALVATACGGTGEVVATVDGSSITYDEVLALLNVEGDTVANDAFLSTLRALIADKAMVEAAAADFGINRTDAEIDAAYDGIVGPLTEGGVSLDDILVANNLTAVGLRAIAGQQVLQEKVEAALVASVAAPAEDELLQRFNANLASESFVCSAHILLDSEEDADAAMERLAAGEDFATLAMEVSTGPSGPNGGDLGCGAPGQFVAEFANATLQADVGVAYGPVRSSFGWHLILVSERTTPIFEDERTNLVTAIAAEQGQQLWTTWLVDSLSAADVVVEPEYGTWTTSPVPSIIPPGG